MNQTSQSRSYRWIVLIAFMGVAGMSQALWLNFAPLLSFIQKRYEVTELLAGTLILSFPLLYVLLSMPAGAMTDRRGYRWTVGFGSLLMALSACLRIMDDSFWWLFAGQIGVAIAQPYILNGITKLSADWFGAEQQALATGLGTAGMFIGMALGMALTPVLVDAYGFQMSMIIFAALTWAAALFFVLTVRENQRPEEIVQHKSFTAWQEFVVLMRDRRLVLLFALAFLALGYFNGLTTWLELILGERGVAPAEAGLVGGVLIVGGILGSLLLPALSDMLRRRKPVLLFCGVAGLVFTYPLCSSGNLTVLFVAGGLLGFLFLPGYALMLAMSEELAGVERAGGAAGGLMLAGNAGGVVVVLVMEALKSDTSGWFPAVLLLLFLLVCIVGFALLVPETFRTRD